MQIGVDAARAVDNKRVFVIDTDEITRAALTFMLQDENETHELASVEQAFARCTERRPDLLLLGLGAVHETAPEIIADFLQTFPGIKILLVDSGTPAGATTATPLAGTLGVLSKPFTIESVRRKVNRLLGRQVSLGIPVEVR